MASFKNDFGLSGKLGDVIIYQKLKETSLRRILKVSAQGNSFNGYTFYLEKNMKVFCADGRIGDFSQLQFSA